MDKARRNLLIGGGAALIAAALFLRQMRDEQ